MNQAIETYNKLSSQAIAKYTIIYSEEKEGGVTIFKTRDQSWGALDDNEKLLVEPVYESIAFYPDQHLFIATNFNKNIPGSNWTNHFIDKKGRLLKKTDDFKFVHIDGNGNLICTQETVVKGEGGKMTTTTKAALLDDQFNFLIPPEFEILQSLSPLLLKARKDGLWGIVTKQGKEILPVCCKQILGSFRQPMVIAQIENLFYQINEMGKKINCLPYSHILIARSHTYAAPAGKNINRFKAILDGIEKEFPDDYPPDEIYLYKGKWGVLHEDGNILIPAVYDYIDFFRDDRYFKAGKGNIEFDDTDGVTMKGILFGVINEKQKEIIPARYNWINEIGKDLWAVNRGGTVYYNSEGHNDHWDVRGGKWGVLNSNAKIIVPIEYDHIMLNWARVKNYIFVQKNSSRFDGTLPHDVFDLTGNQILDNKPPYKDHMYS